MRPFCKPRPTSRAWGSGHCGLHPAAGTVWHAAAQRQHHVSLGYKHLRTQAIRELWGVEPVRRFLSKRLEPATVERVYEADVYPCVFTFADWRRHRARQRYTEHMITLFRSHLLLDLSGPLLNVVGVAVLVALYHTGYDYGLLPQGAPPLTTAWEPFNLMTFALSLMLVFRTNSSYARWTEGRALWGTLVNATRSLLRQVLSAMPESAPELKVAIARWTVAFARVSKLHLREEGDLIAEVSSVLLPHEVDILHSATDKPIAALQVISQLVGAATGIDSVTRSRVESEISTLQTSLGSCEKILRNPIPLSYTRHTARFLVLWLCVLPLSLWDSLGWATVPATGIIAFLLLGIDEIAIQLEEPFGILPLENLCDTVQRNCKQMLDQDGDIRGLATVYHFDAAPPPPPGWALTPRCRFTLAASDSDPDTPQDTPSWAATLSGTTGKGRAEDN